MFTSSDATQDRSLMVGSGVPESYIGAGASNDDNRARFADLILPHLGDAYGLARALTGNRADAEDVVQDACVRAFRAIATVAEGSALRYQNTSII